MRDSGTNGSNGLREKDKERALWNTHLFVGTAWTLCLLYKNEDQKIISEILQKLSDKKIRVEKDKPHPKKEALLAIGASRNPSLVPTLKEYLKSDNAEFRLAAIESMGKIQDEQARKEAGKYIDNSDKQMRLAAASGLAYNQDSKSLNILVQSLADNSLAQSHKAILTALCQYPKDQLVNSLAAYKEDPKIAAILFLLGKKEMENVLVAKLGSSDEKTQKQAWLYSCELESENIQKLIEAKRALLVDKAIQKGIAAYAKRPEKSQYSKHCWGLVLYTLLVCGAKGLEEWIEPVNKEMVRFYDEGWGICPMAFTILALHAMDSKKYRDKIELYTKKIMERSSKRGVWSYGEKISQGGIPWPFTLFPVLALGRVSDLDSRLVSKKNWEDVISFIEREQQSDGSWRYLSEYKRGWGSHTAAAVTILTICMAKCKSNITTDDLLKNDAIKKGITWLNENTVIGENPFGYYYFRHLPYQFLYSLGQAGSISGRSKFGTIDWYKRGSEFIIRTQLDDGTWKSPIPNDTDPVWDTCLALLFLKKDFLVTPAEFRTGK